MLCETIYFEFLYSADQLYLPLFLKDWITGKGITHWYLPPSPYLFPDLFLNFLLYPFVPFLYLPTFFGTLQLGFVLLGISFFLSKYTDKIKSFQFLFLFEILFVFFSLFGYWVVDKPHPLVYFLTGAHHSTGFFFSLLLTLYLYSLLNDEKQRNFHSISFLPNHFIFFFFISFLLLYISDRFSFAVGAFSFFVVRIWDSEKTFTTRMSYFQKRRFWILAFLFLFLGELCFWTLRQIVSIPSSFEILVTYLSKLRVSEIFHLSGAYLWDFTKHIYYQGKSILLLLGLILISFVQFPKLIRHLFLVFLPVLLGLLLLVGRFTYLHPYPIRYLFPLLFFGIFGFTWVLHSKFKSVSLFYLFPILLGLVILLSRLPFPRENTQSYFSSISSKEVPYEWEKPIRFWSQGEKTPIPVGKEGKPYHWITGAFHTP